MSLVGSVRGHSAYLSLDFPESCTLHLSPVHPGTRRDDLNPPLPAENPLSLKLSSITVTRIKVLNIGWSDLKVANAR